MVPLVIEAAEPHTGARTHRQTGKANSRPKPVFRRRILRWRRGPSSRQQSAMGFQNRLTLAERRLRGSQRKGARGER